MDALLGEVDLRFFGYGGFKIQFSDKNNVMKNIYVNVNPDNEDCPEEVKKECPNDADLIMVTNGHAENVRGAPAMMMMGKI